jgi:hypothetical protein
MPTDENIDEVSTLRPVAATEEFEAAFERVKPELDRISLSELQVINLDVPNVVARVLEAVPAIHALRAEFATLPGVNMEGFDKLPDYAHALAHAHMSYIEATTRSERVSKVAGELVAVREALRWDALTLAKRNILDQTTVTNLRRGNGYRSAAFEVNGLVDLFRKNWSRIQGKSPVTLEELTRADSLAAELAKAIGARDQAQCASNEAVVIRQRAYTVLVRAYREVRRGVEFLRWRRGDAGEIAPSLYLDRAGRATNQP